MKKIFSLVLALAITGGVCFAQDKTKMPTKPAAKKEMKKDEANMKDAKKDMNKAKADKNEAKKDMKEAKTDKKIAKKDMKEAKTDMKGAKKDMKTDMKKDALKK